MKEEQNLVRSRNKGRESQRAPAKACRRGHRWHGGSRGRGRGRGDGSVMLVSRMPSQSLLHQGGEEPWEDVSPARMSTIRSELRQVKLGQPSP